MNENKKNPVQRFERMKEVIEQRLESVILIVEATYMRHNLSAMFRTAESFGLQNVYFVCSKNIYKSSASRGSERWLNVEIVDSIDHLAIKLKKEGFSFFIADFADNSFKPNTVPIENKIAICMGTELTGVSKRAKELADGVIQIPMRGFTQSLNVSVACACILQSVTERRRAFLGKKGDISVEKQQILLEGWINREETLKKQLDSILKNTK